MKPATFIYFARPIGMPSPVKIGCSQYPVTRLVSLMTWSPFPLELAVTIPGDLKLEANIHDCLCDLHSHHEWFRDDGRITSLIQSLQRGTPIGEALDLSKRIGTVRRGRRGHRATPDTRLRFSYAQRLRHTEERLGRDSEFYFTAPSDFTAIMARWAGWGRQPSVTPSDAEKARLDEVLADPERHLIRQSRNRTTEVQEGAAA